MITKFFAGTALAVLLSAGAATFGSSGAYAADACSLAADSVQLPKNDLVLKKTVGLAT